MRKLLSAKVYAEKVVMVVVKFVVQLFRHAVLYACTCFLLYGTALITVHLVSVY